jgi:hypothetical protein
MTGLYKANYYYNNWMMIAAVSLVADELKAPIVTGLFANTS